MNQIDDFKNILNLKYSYDQEYVINNEFIFVDLSFFFYLIDISLLL